MIEYLMDVVSSEDLSRHYIIRDGYSFSRNFGDNLKVFDAIVIRNPPDCRNMSPMCGYSKRTLDEHIKLVNDNKLEKAIIVANNIEFIAECPSLKYITIVPGDDCGDGFDYSPLYKLTWVKALDCSTVYGKVSQYRTKIGYAAFENLEELYVFYEGHYDYEKLPSLKKLHIAFNKELVYLQDGFCCENLQEIDIIQCRIKNLRNLERASKLQTISLSYNRSLNDLSDLVHLQRSLKNLGIENCPQISNFDFLKELHELEYLRLYGNNAIENLNFLADMPKLRVFTFSVNVEDGDLRPCMQIPYAYCARKRKHYNLSDRDLPKRIERFE